MLHMIFQPNDFFLDIASIDQKRSFLQHPVAIAGGPQQLLKPQLQSLQIALQTRAPVLLHSLDRFAQMRHTLAKFLLDAAPFLLPHFVESTEHFADSGQHRGLQRAYIRIAGGIECSGNAQNRIEIGLGRYSEFVGCGSKGRDVGAHQRTIQRERLCIATLQAERHLDVTAGNLLLQPAAKLHFERVGARRQTKVKIEKTMVD